MKVMLDVGCGWFGFFSGVTARISAFAEYGLAFPAKLLLLALSIVPVLLAPVPGLAHGVSPNITLVSTLTYLDSAKGEVQVKLVYRGTHDQGGAVATYTSLDGAEVIDEMRDCRLIIADQAWSINCRNPHFRTWDTGRGWYAVSSDVITNGQLVYYDLVGPVTVSLRYDTASQ